MRTSVIVIAILILAISVFSLFFQNMGSRPEEVSLDQVVSLSQHDQIKKIEIDGDWLIVTKTDGKQVSAQRDSTASLDVTYGNLGKIKLNDIKIEVKGASGIAWGNLLINLLPLIIFGGLLYILFRYVKKPNKTQ
jgi:ATP-dependent Zn protease